MFKVGDKVICIDNSGVEKTLKIGEIYTVSAISVFGIKLKEFAEYGAWMEIRFRPANAHIIKKRLGVI